MTEGKQAEDIVRGAMRWEKLRVGGNEQRCHVLRTRHEALPRDLCPSQRQLRTVVGVEPASSRIKTACGERDQHSAELDSRGCASGTFDYAGGGTGSH